MGLIKKNILWDLTRKNSVKLLTSADFYGILTNVCWIIIVVYNEPCALHFRKHSHGEKSSQYGFKLYLVSLCINQPLTFINLQNQHVRADRETDAILTN